MRAGRSGEVATRRETQDADSLRIETPFRRSRAYDANRPGSVLHRRGVMITRAQSILQDEGRNTESVEPLGNGLTFVICQVRVPTSRANDNRRAAPLVFRRQIRC